MYIKLSDKCLYSHPSSELIELLDLKFLNIELENKFTSYKFPILVIENGEIIDIVEDSERIKQDELNYTVVEDKPSQIEVTFAEYVLATEDKLIELQNKLNQLGGI